MHLHNTPATLITRQGITALEHATDVGIAALCAQAVGAMDKTLAMTAEYMNTRKQFGATLSSFQALRHRAADMKMQVELGRSMSYYASLKLNAPAPERRAAMARAKYQIGQSMRYVGQQAVQLHGGIGVTNEYMVSHYFKALTQMEMTYGDSMHQLGEVSARMQDTAGVFAGLVYRSAALRAACIVRLPPATGPAWLQRLPRTQDKSRALTRKLAPYRFNHSLANGPQQRESALRTP